MAKSLHESIAGVNLFIPNAYDTFSIGTGGLPNGDDCLIIGAGDPRAFAPVPTLSPDIFKTRGAGPFTFSCWWQYSGFVGTKAFRMGVQGANTNDATVDDQNPLQIWWDLNNGNGGQVTLYIRGTSVNNTYSTVNNATTSWIFTVIGVGAPGNAGFHFVAVQGSAPPNVLTATTARTAGTGSFLADQYLYLGRYSNTSRVTDLNSNTFKLGKIAFHNRLLTLAECQLLFYRMVS